MQTGNGNGARKRSKPTTSRTAAELRELKKLERELEKDLRIVREKREALEPQN